MYEISQTNKFKKDIKLARKRGLDMKLIDDVITMLSKGKKLPAKYEEHPLKGKYKGCLECHIQPDWLLIWLKSEEIRLISLVRTGTHSDLFK